jgi:serine/threonine protein phosphatase PrpC
MGEYLSSPDRKKDTETGGNDKVRFIATGMQGWRRSMEDSHIAEKDLGGGISFFGVFDGHGGKLNFQKHIQNVSL